MNDCPCCSNRLLRHWKDQQIFWYCLNCRQEMPNFDLIIKTKQVKLFYTRVPFSLINCYQQIPHQVLVKLPFYQQFISNSII